MNESAKSTGTATLQLLSKMLMVIGGLVFLLGDRFLREIMHFNFLLAEVVGILTGLFLCALGFAIGKSVGVRG